jgi:hypothetical protein
LVDFLLAVLIVIDGHTAILRPTVIEPFWACQALAAEVRQQDGVRAAFCYPATGEEADQDRRSAAAGFR